MKTTEALLQQLSHSIPLYITHDEVVTDADTRNRIAQIWQDVTTTQQYSAKVSDTIGRQAIVHLQRYIENAVENLLKASPECASHCIIHTEKPATPLTLPENPTIENTKEVVAAPVHNDPQLLATVLLRPQALRQVMKNGGVVTAIFTEQGEVNLAEKALQQWQESKAKFSKQLTTYHWKNPAPELDDHYSGATYIITPAPEAEPVVFSICAYQANSQSAAQNLTKTWEVYFGRLKEKVINARLTELEKFYGEKVPTLGDTISGKSTGHLWLDILEQRTTQKKVQVAV